MGIAAVSGFHGAMAAVAAIAEMRFISLSSLPVDDRRLVDYEVYARHPKETVSRDRAAT